MADEISFHFEGALADSNSMNFYESARFQYAAARLMVKLAQFRRSGNFVKKITNTSNYDIRLTSQTDGSFNINVEDLPGTGSQDNFLDMSLSDLLAYVGERLIAKIDEPTLTAVSGDLDSSGLIAGVGAEALHQLVTLALADPALAAQLPSELQALVRRRIAEANRESRMAENEAQIGLIDLARSQKLLAMSAPLVSEMAVALRRSADTLEVNATSGGSSKSVLFLDRRMAQEIETATVDTEITPLLGDITQFNKGNGWGKLKIENGARTLSFSIPYDILSSIKTNLIENMKVDLVYLQTYFVRDRGGEVIRLIVVGLLPTPDL